MDMDPTIIVVLILLAIPILALIWVIGIYNGLIRSRNTVDESWSSIDTELKRRYNLIPNLIETVKGYASHEQETLTNVIEARNRAASSNGTPAQQAQDENFLVGALRQIFALSEAYPDLKANQNFQQLQAELTNTEDRIQAARRFYNANVRDFNNRIQMFPSNIIAGMFNFARRDFFEVEDAAVREVPRVKF